MYNQIDANKRKTVILIAVFIIFLIALGWIFSFLYQDYGYSPIALAVLISVIMTLVSYYTGDKIALFTAGAKGPLTAQANPYVYRLVENLCITAGLPVPKIYIIPDAAQNAFACGRDPEHASLALTQGIIDNLENEELEAVVAHELAHIKNYDIRLATIVIVLVGTVAILSDWLWRSRLHRNNDNNNRSAGLSSLLLIIGLIFAILSPLIAQLIQLAISRKREFLADASGALLTRYPEGLARALEKISRSKPLKRVNNATAHLYIASPISGKKVAGLFATHPPIEERIKALRAMA